MEEIDIFKKKAKKEYSKNNSNFKKNDVINISVVDTDNKVIDKLKDVIDKSDYNLKGIFSKGEEFIDFCKNNDIALVFIGLELDGSLNGVETAVNLEYMDIPVIFRFGASGAWLDSKLLFGMDAVISIPLDLF